MKTLVRPASCRKQATTITRIAVAFEAGRDGFWLARWLRKRSIEAHVIHAASVAVSREHRRAKTDRLDTKGLKRVFSSVVNIMVKRQSLEDQIVFQVPHALRLIACFARTGNRNASACAKWSVCHLSRFRCLNGGSLAFVSLMHT